MEVGSDTLIGLADIIWDVSRSLRRERSCFGQASHTLLPILVRSILEDFGLSIPSSLSVICINLL